ncbi:MAG: magnesium transporter [Candidatus Thiodiazotropha sp.]
MTSSTAIIELLRKDYINGFPKDAAKVLDRMPLEEITDLLQSMDDEDTINIWNQLSPDVAMRILDQYPDERAAKLLSSLEIDHVIPILSLFDIEKRQRYLDIIGGETSKELTLMLNYPQDSAGGIMDPKVLLLQPEVTVAEALNRVRQLRRRGVRVLFVVDVDKRLEGTVDVQDLATSSSETTLDEIMRPAKASVNVISSREEVVELLDQYQLTDLPVIDHNGRLVGAVRHQNLVAAAEDEATTAIQTMVGVSRDERALSSVGFAVRKRLPWLHINLATAFLAAAVVGIFESTIAANTALAVLLPVVAGQSGNTGAQALAVTMRGLALREIRIRHWYHILVKEMSAGFWNGLAIALTTSLGVWIWSQSSTLAGIIAISMVLSMVIAGIAGAAIPLLLTWAKQDPAQSSSIVLTTVTDVAGFFSFLAIATLLLDK